MVPLKTQLIRFGNGELFLSTSVFCSVLFIFGIVCTRKFHCRHLFSLENLTPIPKYIIKKMIFFKFLSLFSLCTFVLHSVFF